MAAGRRATYGHIVCNCRPQKENPNRVQLAVGGDCIEYPFDVSTPTADLVTAKLLMKSVIFTKGAKLLTIDMTIFYLNTPMERYEHMCLRYEILPQEIISSYNLYELKMRMDRCILKLKKACMACHRQVYLQTNYLPQDWLSMATTQYNTPQVCGGTNGGQSPLR
eukprot:15189491-Ditylum_brightwellii.AAC.1